MCFKNKKPNLFTAIKTILSLTLILIILNPSFGQELPENFRLRLTKVAQLTGEVLYGSLFSVTDSTIVIINTDKKANVMSGNYQITTIDVNEIKKIKINRKGKVWKTALIGFGTGAFAGAIFGYKQGDDNSGAWGKPDSQAYTGATLFGLLGAGYGLVIGAIIPNRHYRIEGDLDKYLLKKAKIERLAVIK